MKPTKSHIQHQCLDKWSWSHQRAISLQVSSNKTYINTCEHNKLENTRHNQHYNESWFTWMVSCCLGSCFYLTFKQFVLFLPFLSSFINWIIVNIGSYIQFNCMHIFKPIDGDHLSWLCVHTISHMSLCIPNAFPSAAYVQRNTTSLPC